MPTIKLVGHVDQQHRLTATVPPSIAPGTVEVLVLLAGNDEDEAGNAWSAGLATEWHDELSDPREDLYTLADGVPLDESR
jgi:hypothetical protein